MFINITRNVCTLAVGNRISSATRRQPSRSTVRHNRLRRHYSDSEDSDTSDRENSDQGEFFEHSCLNVCYKLSIYSLESSRTRKQVMIYRTHRQVTGIGVCYKQKCIMLHITVLFVWVNDLFLCLFLIQQLCLCNKNQLDALFILRLFRQSTSTCFGHICVQIGWFIM
jgi:hypothetical protein